MSAKPWLFALLAAAGFAAVVALMYAEIDGFRRTLRELVESDTRVTIVNADGSVFFDTSDAVGNHALRTEVQAAFAAPEGRATAIRESETVGRPLLYCARRYGDWVVRLALPYRGVVESERRARRLLWSAGIAGAGAILLAVALAAAISRKIVRQNRALEQARSNEAFRREFTAMFTHELRSPLAAIGGAVEMLGDDTPLERSERAELLGIVREQCDRLNALTGDILALARIENRQLELQRNFDDFRPAQLVERVRELEEPAARQAGVELAAKCSVDGVWRGDARLIEQALVNLVENALRYSGSPRIELTAEKSGGCLVLSVTDYGVGIAAEHLPRLFERFYRVDKARSRDCGGTGLGLAIVKHIANLHGGKASVASEMGVKTVFKLTL